MITRMIDDDYDVFVAMRARRSQEIHEGVVLFRRLFFAKVERGEHEIRLAARDDEALEGLLLLQELVQRKVLFIAQLLTAHVKHGGDLVVLGIIDAEDEFLLPRRVQTRELLTLVLVLLVLQHNLALRLFDAVKLQVELLHVTAVDLDAKFVRAGAELFQIYRRRRRRQSKEKRIALSPSSPIASIDHSSRVVRSSFIVSSRASTSTETTDETIVRARIDHLSRAHAPAIGHVTVVTHCGAMSVFDDVSTDDPGRRRRRGDASMGVFSRSWGDTAWSMGGVCMDVDVVRVGCTYGP